MSAPQKADPVILTCAQPTAQLHLGNLLGAVRNWTELLDSHEAYFGIVDLHAITVPYVPADLRRNCLDLVAQYIACGLDPEKCRIFIQSHVHGHTELAWILGCLCPLGQLERMTQFKDKARARGESVGAGLLYYPVLMAADILLYNADLVPVGEDQKQHLELTRDLADKFNHTYTPTFTVPEPLIKTSGARIMSLQEPEKKMSKSDAQTAGTLFLFDEPAQLRKKIMSAVTDSGSEVKPAPDKPGITNLLQILSVVTTTPVSELETRFAGKGYGDFKAAVADAVLEMLQPIQERYQAIKDDKDYLNGVLKAGADAAQKRAYRTLGKVYRKAGLPERPR
ncbi:MAG: tryptophan--tRNA ligase [Opitutales bacterium]